METVKASQAKMSLTGINRNITFSKEQVWAWVELAVPAEEFTLDKDNSSFVYETEQALQAYANTQRKTVEYHLIVSNVYDTEFPLVLLGVKVGDRETFSSNKIMPQIFDNLINLIADAPVDDYLSEKELEHWKEIADKATRSLCASLSSRPAKTEQIAFAIRKNFYPAMSLPEIYDVDNGLTVWGENELSHLFDAKIINHPKYLTITQDIGGVEVTGYRNSLEIIKPSETQQFPPLSLWLDHLKEFPFQVDYSIRFKIKNTKQVNKKVETVVNSYKINLEAASTDELKDKTSQVIEYYKLVDTLVAWTTGDHVSLLRESIPNGENIDSKTRIKKNELSLTHIYNDITFSKTNVWLWVKIPPQQYEFLDDENRIRLANEMNLTLANLVTSEEKGVECHMIVSSRPFDSLAWIRDLNDKVNESEPTNYSQDFLYEMYNHVEHKDFREKVVLLGVNIGKRVSYSPNKSASPTLLENLTSIVSAPPVADNISEKELDYWTRLARQTSSALQSSRVQAVPATAAEIAFAVRKNFHPDMPSPTPDDLSVGIENVWGPAEVACLADAQIENHPKFLKITQEINGQEVVGYRATLCFSKFPEVMHFPQWEPWIHYASLLPFTTDFSLRFTLEPARKVRKEVDKKLKEAVDQAKNMGEAGGNVSQEVQEHIYLGNELDFALKKDTTPWVFGRYRITIEADSEEELHERAKQVIDHYNGMEIVVTWPTGDQLSLLKEGLPNDKIRIPSYYQRQELSIVAAGMAPGSGSTGDNLKYEADGSYLGGWIGHYIGYTTGRVEEPVFLSMHSTIDNRESPGLVITGSPGGGKTFAALTMTYHMALSGVWTIYIDPKADAMAMRSLPGLENNTKIIDLKNGNDGILDPFSMGTSISQQMELALEVIGLFVGGQDHLTDPQNIALGTAIEVIASYENPSLSAVVDYLVSSPDSAAASLGARLKVIRTLPFAQLCFSKNTGQSLRPQDGLTIVTLLGLDLPPAGLPRDSYSNSNRLAVGVMYLLTSFTRGLMQNADKKHPKAIIIDEAWAIAKTTQGAKLIEEVARMGRSHNTALMLVSQNANDFNGTSVTNSVSTKMAFRAKETPEIDEILGFLNLELSDTNRDSIRNLNNGECLIRDWSGRIARVQIDGWNQKQRRAFETNPGSQQSQ